MYIKIVPTIGMSGKEKIKFQNIFDTLIPMDPLLSTDKK